jgi:hypothetical protein
MNVRFLPDPHPRLYGEKKKRSFEVEGTLPFLKHFDASPVPVLLEKNVLSSVVHLAANALGIDLDVDRPTLLRGKKNFSLHTIDREELSL